MDTHNLCFGSKFKKKMDPLCTPVSFYIKIKIIFVSPYPTDPRKLHLPKNFYCSLAIFSIQDFFFNTERQKFHVLKDKMSDLAFKCR